jgi:putative membrane protein
MKKIIRFCEVLIFGLLVQACGNVNTANNQNNADSMKSMNDSTSLQTTDKSASAVVANPVDKACTDFAMDAEIGGMMEIQLGQSAQGKATNGRIKAFGTMMVRDHSKANEELMARAKSQGITLPANIGKEDQTAIDNLSRKTGVSFDKSYMNMMLEDHKKVIASFKKAAGECTNPSIREFASQTLPILDKHLDSAKAITGNN